MEAIDLSPHTSHNFPQHEHPMATTSASHASTTTSSLDHLRGLHTSRFQTVVALCSRGARTQTQPDAMRAVGGARGVGRSGGGGGHHAVIIGCHSSRAITDLRIDVMGCMNVTPIRTFGFGYQQAMCSSGLEGGSKFLSYGQGMGGLARGIESFLSLCQLWFIGASFDETGSRERGRAPQIHP